MNVDDLFQAYEAHIAGVDGEFRRVFQKFAHRMQCRRGCSMCCSQMFSISLIEAAYISRAIKALPDEERERLRSSARGYVARARALTSGEEDQEDEGITPKPGARLPCPALKGDACSIYDARPIICRKWGIPLFNPKKPLEIQACHLNFQPGEEIDMDGLIEPQVALLEEWVELKRRAGRDLNHPKMTATIAEAILEDYEQILEDHTAGK
ncbi:MAG TPA: YkgJ family cysteine cluster protein [Blastocatellia bacterium]|nr:YkgJ family cysteine cluster protein [Blastocatellia bacterium]